MADQTEDGPLFIPAIVMVIVCMCSGALANGLTQGLLSISPLEMAIKLRSGTEVEKEEAHRILPIISRHHFLLCTLMLFNASANEALPIFLDFLVPSWLSVLISVVLVLLCGEIIPASIFTGPHQIKLAASLSPVVVVLMAIFSPIAYPLAILLDYAMGHDEGLTVYNRNEITAMMQIQHEEGKRLNATDSIKSIDEVEIMMIEGVLTFRERTAAQVMTPIDKVFTLPITGHLDLDTVTSVQEWTQSSARTWRQRTP